MEKRILIDKLKAEIVHHGLTTKNPEGIVLTFNPELDEFDLIDLNQHLLGFGLEAGYNQLYDKRKKKLTVDKLNVFVYRKENDNQSDSRVPRKAKSGKG